MRKIGRWMSGFAMMRATVLAFLFMLATVAVASAGMPIIAVTIKTNAGATRTDFIAELAQTAKDRASGLMFRTELADNRGMLFAFKESRSVSMWMKNTPLSLDMIFCDEHGVVLYVARDAVPYSEEIITPGVPAYAVLEVKAGTARKLNLKPGDRLITRLFGAPG